MAPRPRSHEQPQVQCQWQTAVRAAAIVTALLLGVWGFAPLAITSSGLGGMLQAPALHNVTPGVATASMPERPPSSRTPPSPQHQWDEISSCLRETPCASLKSLRASPPSFSEAEAHFIELFDATKAWRAVPVTNYAGFAGPWFDNYIDTVAEGNTSAFFARFYPTIPLVVQWTDICNNRKDLMPKVTDFMRTRLRSDLIYVAITQYDTGLCVFEKRPLQVPLDVCEAQPPNILHFSGGGHGNVPIPLIMGDKRGNAPVLPRSASSAIVSSVSLGTHPRGFRVAATTRLTELGKAWGFTGNSFMHQYTGPQYLTVQSEGLLISAPRGFGRSSFRSTELVQLGMPQLFLWDDTPWLPYWHPDPNRRRGRPVFWGPGGIGLAMRVDELGGLRDSLCNLLTPARGKSPCSTDSAPFLKMPVKVLPDMPLAASEKMLGGTGLVGTLRIDPPPPLHTFRRSASPGKGGGRLALHIRGLAGPHHRVHLRPR